MFLSDRIYLHNWRKSANRWESGHLGQNGQHAHDHATVEPHINYVLVKAVFAEVNMSDIKSAICR